MPSRSNKVSRSRPSSSHASRKAGRNKACNLPLPRQQQTHKAPSGAPYLASMAQTSVDREAHNRELMATLMSSPSPTHTRLVLRLQARREAVQDVHIVDVSVPCTATVCISLGTPGKLALPTQQEPSSNAILPSPSPPLPPTFTLPDPSKKVTPTSLRSRIPVPLSTPSPDYKKIYAKFPPSKIPSLLPPSPAPSVQVPRYLQATANSVQRQRPPTAKPFLKGGSKAPKVFHSTVRA